MKIPDVKVTLIKGIILIRVYTDEGIVGIGECSGMNGSVIQSVVEDFLKPTSLRVVMPCSSMLLTSKLYATPSVIPTVMPTYKFG